MATLKHALAEHDFVELTEPIDKDETLTRDPGEPRGIGQWPAGTRGTVVSDYGDAKLVEISDHDNWGAALDYIVVPESRLKLITRHSG
jgi:hypothetical protein